MDRKVHRAASFEAQKAEEYVYWQSVSSSERVAAALQMSKDAYRRKGLYEDGQGLDRTIVSLRPAYTVGREEVNLFHSADPLTSNKTGDEFNELRIRR